MTNDELLKLVEPIHTFCTESGKDHAARAKRVSSEYYRHMLEGAASAYDECELRLRALVIKLKAEYAAKT